MKTKNLGNQISYGGRLEGIGFSCTYHSELQKNLQFFWWMSRGTATWTAQPWATIRRNRGVECFGQKDEPTPSGKN
jgi:hypothetical protein